MIAYFYALTTYQYYAAIIVIVHTYPLMNIVIVMFSFYPCAIWSPNIYTQL